MVARGFSGCRSTAMIVSVMFAELLLPVGIAPDRDEIEESLVAAFHDRLEVTGAGTGEFGSNLDLTLLPNVNPDELVAGVRATLTALGVVGAKLRISDGAEWTDL